MKAAEKVSRTDIRSVLLYLGVALLFLFFVVQWRSNLKRHGGTTFVDARVYARAITTWDAGEDPYVTPPDSLPFVYPPIFLKVAASLGRVSPRHMGWYAYLALDGICVLAIPWLLTTVYVRSRWLTSFLAMILFTFQPGFIEEYVLLTGNIVNLFYPLALAAGILGLRRNKWMLFYVVVAAAAVLKPTFLGLLLLPLLAGERQLVRSVICVGSVCSIFLLQRFFMPQSYAAFQQNVFAEIFIRGDAGFNIFNYLHKQGRTFVLLRNPLVLSAIHFAIIGAIVAGFFLMRRCRKRVDVADLWVPALLVVAVLANPRMQHIDSDIAVIPALYLCVECVRRIPASRYSLAGVIVAFTVLEFLLVKQFEMGLLMILYSSVLLVLFLLARAMARQDGGPSAEPQDASLPAEFA